jgi:hypothetical protein
MRLLLFLSKVKSSARLSLKSIHPILSFLRLNPLFLKSNCLSPTITIQLFFLTTRGDNEPSLIPRKKPFILKLLNYFITVFNIISNGRPHTSTFNLSMSFNSYIYWRMCIGLFWRISHMMEIRAWFSMESWLHNLIKYYLFILKVHKIYLLTIVIVNQSIDVVFRWLLIFLLNFGRFIIGMAIGRFCRLFLSHSYGEVGFTYLFDYLCEIRFLVSTQFPIIPTNGDYNAIFFDQKIINFNTRLFLYQNRL